MTAAIILATGGSRDGARLRAQLASINVPDVHGADGPGELARLTRRANVPILVLPDDLVVSTGLLDRLVSSGGAPLITVDGALLRFEPSQAEAVAETAESLPSGTGDVLEGLLAGLRGLAEQSSRGEVCRRGVGPEDLQAELDEADAAYEERKRMATAVKSGDGFFTTFAVSSYTPHLVRLLAGRGITPNTVTAVSMVLAVLAAMWFSAGTRGPMITGAVLCYLSFVLDCVDGQLARYTGRTSPLGAWLDAVGDRAKEYVIYLGLAIGARSDDVWALALAAMVLQTVRHMIDFSYQAGARASADEAVVARLSRRTSGSRPLHWAKKMIVLPIGERFALIAVTAALFDARVTFVALLVWGTVAVAYTLTGRLLRSLAARGQPGSELLQLYRDDGPVSGLLGGLAAGRLPPLPGLAVALAISAVLLVAGLCEQRSIALFAPVVALLLTGPAAGHPHNGRIDWLVPPGIRAIEYGYLAALGCAQDVPRPLVFVLIAVLAYHHYDIVYRTRQGHRPPERLVRAGLGWDGRMLLVTFAGVFGLLPFAYATFAVYLGVMFVADSVQTWAPETCDAVRGAARGFVRGFVVREGGPDAVAVDLEKEEA